MAADRPENVFMDRWALEPKTQRVWGVPHATWFTLMALGGGLFILGRLLGAERIGAILGIPMIDVVSFAAIAVGGLILIADLGRPLRFWRAFLNVRTSWIAWGAWSDLVFLTAGGLLVLPSLRFGDSTPFGGLPWDAAADSAAGHVLEIAAGLAAVVVMFYAGAVLARPRAIPYWHSVAVPLQFMASGFVMAAATVLVLDVAYDAPVQDAHLWSLIASTALLLLLVVYHLSTDREVPGKRESLDRLLRGRHRAGFLGGVVLVGHVVPLGLAAVALAADGIRDVAAVASALTVPGGFLLRLLTLRVGIFPPVRHVVPRRAARGADPGSTKGSLAGWPARGEAPPPSETAVV